MCIVMLECWPSIPLSDLAFRMTFGDLCDFMVLGLFIGKPKFIKAIIFLKKWVLIKYYYTYWVRYCYNY